MSRIRCDVVATIIVDLEPIVPLRGGARRHERRVSLFVNGHEEFTGIVRSEKRERSV
jgi:hypothetical protein